MFEVKVPDEYFLQKKQQVAALDVGKTQVRHT
jgi:hypothetical protein